ncbi:IclR family transcriptional regulator [Bifidobacterium sp. SO4]|uniref:IclR family transcriptional regulator n=1 Tax=Bifidobacterium sp. SO4 TaxID=2809030 RepID=UPI001BDD183A|nr:IclR family transcriptional regulator [Bifidobacterium sp. SO4]MBT1170608.1 IclR family transcriptional regulator [Bifidobacterium sp. SO4]
MIRTDEPAVPGAQTLINGIAVLRAVAAGAHTLADLTAATGLSRSTTHRLVQALRAERMLRDTVEGTLALGPALIELGFQAREDISVPAIARPYLLDLSDETRDTVHLAAEDNGETLYLDKVRGNRNIEIRSWPGCRMPLTYTGIGKALLLDCPDRWERQYLDDRARMERQPEHDYSGAAAFAHAMGRYARQGFAFDLEENEPGVRCIAAPVRDAGGAIVCAISVSSFKTFMPTDRMRQLGPFVRDTADTISRDLGWNGR